MISADKLSEILAEVKGEPKESSEASPEAMDSVRSNAQDAAANKLLSSIKSSNPKELVAALRELALILED